MTVKIRLARAGAKKAPLYRVVVADSRSPRDGRFIEIIGRYNPRTQPSTVEIDIAKADAWIAKGAQPSEVVAKLIAIVKGEKTAPVEVAKVSKKSAAKAEAASKKAAEPVAEVPVAAEAPVEAPVVEETPVEVPVVEETPTQAPVAVEEPVVDEAPAEEPVAEEAATDTADDAPAADETAK